MQVSEILRKPAGHFYKLRKHCFGLHKYQHIRERCHYISAGHHYISEGHGYISEGHDYIRAEHSYIRVGCKNRLFFLCQMFATRVAGSDQGPNSLPRMARTRIQYCCLAIRPAISYSLSLTAALPICCVMAESVYHSI